MSMPVFLIFMWLMDIELNTQPLFHKVLSDKPTSKLNTVFKAHLFIIRKGEYELLLHLAVFSLFTAFNFIPQHRAVLELLIYAIRQKNFMMNIPTPILKGEKLPSPITPNRLALI